VRAPSWKLDSGGSLSLEGDSIIFKIDFIDRLLGRKGFSIKRDEIVGWEIVESSSLRRRLPAVKISTSRGGYLFMFPKIRGPSPEERRDRLVKWLEGRT